jgi:dienelactone hydrolase
MPGGFKQKLDRIAIRLAAQSLAPPCPDPYQGPEAMELVQTAGFLTPPEITPHLSWGPDGAFQFLSTRPTGPSENNHVRGKFYLGSSNWRQRPFVVLVHGWNAEVHYKSILPLVARALNRRGFNAALLQLPYHLQRRPRSRQGSCDFICDNIPGMLRVTRQAIADMHSLLIWARAQGCPTSALWGFSLGAWLIGLHSCHSALADAAVLTTPVSNLERAVNELEFCHPIRAALTVAPVPIRSLNLSSHPLRLSPDAISVMEGEYDLFVPAETYQELAKAWNLRAWVRVPQSHISVLTSPSAMKQSIRWLAERLL